MPSSAFENFWPNATPCIEQVPIQWMKSEENWVSEFYYIYINELSFDCIMRNRLFFNYLIESLRYFRINEQVGTRNWSKYNRKPFSPNSIFTTDITSTKSVSLRFKNAIILNLKYFKSAGWRYLARVLKYADF